MAQATLLDIAKLNGTDAVVGLIEEVFNMAPEVSRFPARSIRGTSYWTATRTALPSAAFRNANEGVAGVKSTTEKKLVETYILDAQIRCDKAVADAYEDGAAAYQAMEAEGVVLSALQSIGTQVWYGTGTNGSSKGFPGALQVVDSNMVVSAGGTTDSINTSVWGVKFGDKYSKLVFGNGGSLSMGDWRIEQVITSGSGTTASLQTAYVSSFMAYPGLQIGNKYSVGRIKLINDTDSGKGLTDALLAKLYEKFLTYIGQLPDAFFMTARSLRQWQASRTATSPTGAPAPFPDNFMGIPAVVTDRILNTETLTL